MGRPGFPLNLGEIGDNAAISHETPFRPLIADKYAEFPAPFQPPPREPDISLNLEDSYPRLAFEQGSHGVKLGCPRFT